MIQALHLKNRSLIECGGEDCLTFLQGLITNDIKHLTADKPLYAGFLTPQGKYLFDFILYQHGDSILIDCEADRADELLKRLMMFRLRAKVTLTSLADSQRVWAIWSGGEENPALSYPCFIDPRHWKMGHRAIVPKGVNLTLPDDGSQGADPLKLEDYEVERITLGIPDGSRDMAVDKYFWLECRAEATHGVSFSKGCFIGQEQTTRMKHRTTIKKSLLPVRLSGEAESGNVIEAENGKEAGQIHTVAGKVAMAYLRLKYCDQALRVRGKTVTPLTD